MIQPPVTRWESHELVWGSETYVMAILNITPDSFSGDGLLEREAEAIEMAASAEAEGADLLDIGGQSTRPGHTPISPTEELQRVVPVVREVAKHVSIPISVDTSSALVAEEALRAGASIINDVRGLSADPELAEVAAQAGVPVIVMHDRGADGHEDLVTSVVRELSRRLDRAVAAGIAWENLIIDPGFGFGKDWRDNLLLLRRLGELRVLGRPILSGTSRKGTIGKILDLPPDERVEGTAATVVIAIANGADIVRIHDVREMVRVARMTDAIVRGVE